MQSTEPGALTWLHFDNLECRQLCRLFDATEVAQMEDRLIMSIAREAAPYFRDFRDRAFSIDPSIEPTEDNPYPIDEFYLHPAALGFAPPANTVLYVLPTAPMRLRLIRTSKFHHVVPVPTVYSLPDSDDEEEADRKVGDAEDAAGDESAPSSPTKAEGSSKSASASTSKPGGTIHVKKEGAASVKTPATSMTLTVPCPSRPIAGAPSSTAAPPTPEAKQLFDDELLPDSSSKPASKRPQVEIYTQGRPPSLETEQLEQKHQRHRGRDPEANSSRKAAKAHAAALPPAGERDVDPATHLEVVPHDAVAELTDGSLPDENTIACGTCAAREAAKSARSPAPPRAFHQILESLRPLIGFKRRCACLGRHVCRSSSAGHGAALRHAHTRWPTTSTASAPRSWCCSNHQSSVLPLSHLEQMFEDPEDIQMLRELSERAAEASFQEIFGGVVSPRTAGDHLWSDSSGFTYYARHKPRDSTVRPSKVSDLLGL
ncbi:hypothetical protein B0H14DRAFT_3534891 [Mycena olivaceomarginata]|nr:hypothetical protein B0H14DRAFT_3534891 [Mycena olivaceomarginata]